MICDACALSKTSRCVGYKGNVKSDIMILGQNPDADEERIGKPFAGRCGNLLDVMISSSGLTPNDVYITNVIKCMTLNNREPFTHEIFSCTQKWLERELAVINPAVVIALGSVAIQFTCGISSVELARSKGVIRLMDRDFVVVPTYHPSYYLCSKDVDLSVGIKDFGLAVKARDTMLKYRKLRKQ